MKRLLAAAVLALVLTGCSAGSPDGPSSTDRGEPDGAATTTAAAPVTTAAGAATADENATFLTDHDLAGLDGPAIVDRLEALAVADRPTDYKASVRPRELLLTETGGREVSIPLPDDLFYLALAPYVDGTHDCFFHSPTSCQGELAMTAVHVTITATDGTVLVDEDTTTHPDGFVAYWLPRGTSGTVEVTHGDHHAGSFAFTTADDAPTCVTTLRLT